MACLSFLAFSPEERSIHSSSPQGQGHMQRGPDLSPSVAPGSSGSHVQHEVILFFPNWLPPTPPPPPRQFSSCFTMLPLPPPNILLDTGFYASFLLSLLAISPLPKPISPAPASAQGSFPTPPAPLELLLTPASPASSLAHSGPPTGQRAFQLGH